MADTSKLAAVPAVPPTFEPGRTLGRSPFNEHPRDALSRKAAQLDALMCLIDGEEEDGMADFQRFNSTIQKQALRLAADLAQEVHELVAEVGALHG